MLEQNFLPHNTAPACRANPTMCVHSSPWRHVLFLFRERLIPSNARAVTKMKPS